jgi:hypothetical protein
MKKIMVFVCFFVLAVAGCATQPAGNKDTVANTNAAQPSDTKSMAVPSEADIIAKEKATWDAVKKKDWDAFGNMMASDFIEVLDGGMQDKAAAMAAIKDFEVSDVTYADWKMISIDKDAAIITYTATLKGKFKGEAVPEGPYRNSAVWVNRNDQWSAVFFQSTMAEKMPATTSPPPDKKAPAASSNTSIKPPEASSDLIANEKAVWDLFKSRNFDAFATLLAPEFVEIESAGLYDKAGSVKGVQEMDASEFQLADWKAVKFDDDAGLVTYTVTFKGDKAYHSSIWANRDGKWLALLHQGTPAEKKK